MPESIIPMPNPTRHPEKVDAVPAQESARSHPLRLGNAWMLHMAAFVGCILLYAASPTYVQGGEASSPFPEAGTSRAGVSGNSPNSSNSPVSSSANPSPEVGRAREARTDLEMHEIRQMIRRLFEGGGYEQVVAVTEALLQNPAFAPYPPVRDTEGAGSDSVTALQRRTRQHEREWTWFQQARALYEWGRREDRRSLVEQAARGFVLLAENRRGFDTPQFRPESRFWAGAAHEALQEWRGAIAQYAMVSAANPEPELDVEASLALARALQVQADRIMPEGIDRSPREDPRPPEELVREQEGMLRRAVDELLKISTAYQMSERREEAELMLMQLYLRMKEYGELQRLTESFLSRVPYIHPDYARAAYYRAQAAYWQGDVAAAAVLYRDALDQETDNADVLVDLLYGYGQANARLAETAAPDQRLQYLQRAQNALRRALQRMPFNDARRVPTALRFAEVLIELGEYREALQEARRILDAAPGSAGYFAGVAAEGLGDTARAVAYFQQVILDTRGEVEPERQLDAMEALARMQEEAGASAEALEYYRDAEALAVRLRSFTRVAAMRLGMARSLIGLGGGDPERTEAALGMSGEALLRFLHAAMDGDPGVVERSAVEVARRVRIVEGWQEAGEGNFTRAEALLRQLEGRLAARLRKDEIDLVRGLAFLAQAEQMRVSLPVTRERQPEEYAAVFALYAQAVSFFERALVVNPRGMLSGRSSYELGRTHYRAGTLSAALAARLRDQDLGADAVVLQQEADKAFRDALRPLRHAVVNLPEGSVYRVSARTLLGDTHFALGAYEEGLVEYRALAEDPTLPREAHLEAIRRWAQAWMEIGNKEQAVELLAGYADQDLRAGILSARFLLELEQPRRAYETVLASLQAATDAEEERPRVERAEALMLANDIILRYVERMFRDPDAQAGLRREARIALGNVILDYPETVWAAQAASAMGASLRGAGQWREARQEAARLRGRIEAQDAADTVEVLQALDIQEARALLGEAEATAEAGLYEEVLRLLARAEMRPTRTDAGQALRAAAVRVQGKVYEAMGDEARALRMYQRVFSLYHLVREEADSARLAAAAVYAGQGDFARAVRVLEEGADQDRLRPMRLEYETRRRREGRRP